MKLIGRNFVVIAFFAIFHPVSANWDDPPKNGWPKLSRGSRTKSIVRFVHNNHFGVIIDDHYVLTTEDNVRGEDEVRVKTEMLTPDLKRSKPNQHETFISHKIYHNIKNHNGQPKSDQKSGFALVHFLASLDEHGNKKMRLCNESMLNFDTVPRDDLALMQAWKTCLLPGDIIHRVDMWKNPICVMGLVGSLPTFTHSLDFWFRDECIIEEGSQKTRSEFRFYGSLEGWQKAISTMIEVENYRWNNQCPFNFSTISGFSPNRCFRVFGSDSFKTSVTYNRKLGTKFWAHKTYSEFGLVNKYLYSKFVDVDQPRVPAVTSIWLGFQQIFSAILVRDSTRTLCGLRIGPFFLISCPFSPDEVQAYHNEIKMGETPFSKFWSVVEKMYFDQGIEKEKCPLCYAYRDGQFTELDDQYSDDCDFYGSVALLEYDYNNGSDLSECHPGFEIISGSDLLRTTCFRVLSESLTNYEDSAAACKNDSFSSIWHPWEINDLTAVYYFLSNKYYNSEYTLQPSLNKLHFNLSDDTKFWLGYKNMLSDKVLQAASRDETITGYVNQVQKMEGMNPLLWKTSKISADGYSRCSAYSSKLGVHSIPCETSPDHLPKEPVTICTYPVCPAGFTRTAWSLQTNKCYKTLSSSGSDSYRNFFEAASDCKKTHPNSTILETDSEEEVKQLRVTFPIIQTLPLWIGVTKYRDFNGRYEFEFTKLSSGAAIDKLDWIWSDKHPNNINSLEKCVTTDGHLNRMTDANCIYKKSDIPHAVCQIERMSHY